MPVCEINSPLSISMNVDCPWLVISIGWFSIVDTSDQWFFIIKSNIKVHLKNINSFNNLINYSKVKFGLVNFPRGEIEGIPDSCSKSAWSLCVPVLVLDGYMINVRHLHKTWIVRSGWGCKKRFAFYICSERYSEVSDAYWSVRYRTYWRKFSGYIPIVDQNSAPGPSKYAVNASM